MTSSHANVSDFIWNGLGLTTPDNWEPAALERDSLLLECDGRPVCELKWRTVQGTFSFEKHLKRLSKSNKGVAVQAIPEHATPEKWARGMERLAESGLRMQSFIWGEGEHRGIGAALHNPATGMAALVQFLLRWMPMSPLRRRLCPPCVIIPAARRFRGPCSACRPVCRPGSCSTRFHSSRGITAFGSGGPSRKNMQGKSLLARGRGRIWFLRDMLRPVCCSRRKTCRTGPVRPLMPRRKCFRPWQPVPVRCVERCGQDLSAAKGAAP